LSTFVLYVLSLVYARAVSLLIDQ